MDNPETYTLDTIGGNGTPFRFVFWPGENGGTVRYYDRRYPMAEGETGYGINRWNENGQCCGGARSVDDFVGPHVYGLRGWHEVDVWDVDRATVVMVGDWIEEIRERDPR